MNLATHPTRVRDSTTGPPADVEIRALRAGDDLELREMYDALREALLHENPARPMWSLEVFTAMIREPDDDIAFEAWVAADADGGTPRVHGSCFVVRPLNDNRQMAFVGLSVRPDMARQGIGAAFVERVVGSAAEHGRSLVLADAMYRFEDRDDHGYRRFAERHGFQVASTEVTRRLDLPVSEDQLQAWIDEAAPFHADYRIETFNEIPDELLQSVCDVENQLALDAPTGDVEFEAQSRTPEHRRQARERNRASGVTSFETVAVEPSGRVVAVTSIDVARGEGGDVRQGGTIVARAHRGHRLGLAIKAANLRAAQRAFPERTAVHTSNHEDNANMVAINERMGFRPMELHVQFLRALDLDDAG